MVQYPLNSHQPIFVEISGHYLRFSYNGNLSQTHHTYICLLMKLLCRTLLCSAKPEVRGTAEPHGGANPPSSPPLVRPHDYHHYLTADRRAETDVLTLIEADAPFASFLCSLRPGECIYRGPRTTSF